MASPPFQLISADAIAHVVTTTRQCPINLRYHADWKRPGLLSVSSEVQGSMGGPCH